MLFRWRGAGFLVPLLWLAACGLSAYGANRIDLLGTAGVHRPSLVGVAILIGSIVAALVVYVLGLSLNRRRASDGTWYRTGWHAYAETPVEQYWKPMLGAAFFGYFASVSAQPGWIVWPVTAALVLWTAYRQFRDHRRRRRDRTGA